MAYRNKAHYGNQEFEWDPSKKVFSGGIEQTSPGYLTELLALQDRVRAGTAKSWEAEELRRYEAEARSIPTRDIGSLRAGWQGELEGQWTDNGWQEGSKDWWSRLDPMSPDVGPIVLQLRDKIQAGTATPQERTLFTEVMKMGGDWDYRASRPQESDANPFGLGDNLMGALMILGLGSGAAAAIAPLMASAGLTLSGISGLAASTGSVMNLLSEPLDSDVMRKAGLAVGVVGGATSLASLLSGGLNSVGDVVKAVQKVYGTGTKAMNLINAVKQAGDNPAALKQAQQAADNRTQGRTVSNTQASTAQGDGMDFSQLGRGSGWDRRHGWPGPVLV